MQVIEPFSYPILTNKINYKIRRIPNAKKLKHIHMHLLIHLTEKPVDPRLKVLVIEHFVEKIKVYFIIRDIYFYFWFQKKKNNKKSQNTITWKTNLDFSKSRCDLIGVRSKRYQYVKGVERKEKRYFYKY